MRIERMQGPDGDLVSVVEVPYEIDTESWSEYVFSDGGRVRLKTCALKVYMIVSDDGQPVRDDSDSRIIFVQHDTHVMFSESA